MPTIITSVQAADMVQDGTTLMVGGFMGRGGPGLLAEALLDRGVNRLTLIVCDNAAPDYGIGKLVAARRVAKTIVSHIGLNPVSGALMNSGEMEVELVPQGTLAERIRCGGAGLGGVLTPAGVGTIVAEGKQLLHVGDRDYLLELPLRADVALIKAHKADKLGNLIYRRAARNFNPLMAMAADLVIAEVDEIAEIGQLDPDTIHTPGILVDYLVDASAEED